ncbi:MAG TPA: helix-turn-helix domain-containing protein [Methylomicrobium sp.]|nr:helix-turn-helix domain-containing protein [Methylomicrobium sp.]
MNTLKKNLPHLFDRRDVDQVDRREIDLDSQNASSLTLSAYVKQAVDIYFAQMKDHDVVNLHAIVMNEVEKPLLESALRHSGYNQTKAAKALGLSRCTLRKKLEQYGLS